MCRRHRSVSGHFGLLALLGLHTVIETMPKLYLLIKIGGASYLLYLASLIWRGASQTMAPDLQISERSSLWRSFLAGLLIQITNPKTAVVFASVFAAFLPHGTTLADSYLLVPVIFLVDFGWYVIVAVVLSSHKPREFYLSSKQWIDRAAASVLGALGIKLLSQVFLDH